jgi:tripartite-type tricarboxylate transporter receptor subunit TctC
MQHIPYKGTAGALQDTVGGQINVMFDIVGPLMPQVAPATPRRSSSPRKSGFRRRPTCRRWRSRAWPDFVSGTWAGIIAPAGTPKEIVDRVAAEARKALADPAMKAETRRAGNRCRWRRPG